MAEKIFKERFCEIKKIKVCTTTAELDFNTYTEPGTYEIYEDMGGGRSRIYLLTVDKSVSGACLKQTRIYCGIVETRQTNTAGTWTTWASVTSSGTGELGDSPVRAGQGEGSIVQEGNIAIGDSSVAFGDDTRAGCYGFRITEMQANDESEIADDHYSVIAESGGYYMLDATNISSVDLMGLCYSIRIKAACERVGNVTDVQYLPDSINPTHIRVEVDKFFHPNHWHELTEEEKASYMANSYMFFDEAPGVGVIPIGYGAHAEGVGTSALSKSAHSEGVDTLALGIGSHSEGIETVARYSSHAEGIYTKATGYHSHAENYRTIASGDNSHAEGQDTLAGGEGSHAEGIATKALQYGAHAEGFSSVAKGRGSHAEGMETEADEHAHAEGSKTKAAGVGTHAEGVETEATQQGSHAEGYQTKATGYFSHAEGQQTEARHTGSHAGGVGNTTSGDYQYFIGKFGDRQKAMGHLLVVGNGKDEEHRSNAFSITEDGHAALGNEEPADPMHAVPKVYMEKRIERLQKYFMPYNSGSSNILNRTPLAKGNIFIAGDSITIGYSADGSVKTPWTALLQARANITNIKNKAKGGAAFAEIPGYSTIIGQFSSENISTRTHIIVAAGTNDYSLGTSKEAFETALNTLATYLNNNKGANTQVIVITPINRTRAAENEVAPLSWYRAAIMDCAKENNYSAIDGAVFGFPIIACTEQEALMPDGLHPSQLGHDVYAEKVYDILIHGNTTSRS